MSDVPQQGFMSKIGSWFRRGPRPANGELLDPDHGATTLPSTVEARGSILRPWAKRDQAIANLNEGFHTLTELMGAIKDNLNDQGRRQDELLKYLSHLPQAIQSIPESNRIQGETLRAIHARLEQQNEQQRLIAEILDKVNESGTEQRQTVDEVRSRVETIAEHDRKMSDNLSSVGAAMQTVSRNSQASAQVLEQLRDNINNRDGQLERILHKQAMRFTTMLAVAIFLSIAALGAVALIGWQLMNRPQGGTTPTTTQPPAPAEIRAVR
jgi:chromosome segregation ATPase